MLTQHREAMAEGAPPPSQGRQSARRSRAVSTNAVVQTVDFVVPSADGSRSLP